MILILYIYIYIYIYIYTHTLVAAGYLPCQESIKTSQWDLCMDGSLHLRFLKAVTKAPLPNI